jgi:nitroreductase
MNEIKHPIVDETLEAIQPSAEVLNFLARRRSTLVRDMASEDAGPDAAQLETILQIAARVPDHRKLTPWRFEVFQGAARAEFGEHLAAAFSQDYPLIKDQRLEFERTRFMRAPVVICVISSPKNCPRGTAKWEQELSAGAVCMSMLLAARASGFAAQWLTEWYAYDSRINLALGLTAGERVAGYIYLGTATEFPVERPRADMAALTSFWGQ